MIKYSIPLLFSFVFCFSATAEPFMHSGLIFPLEHWHNHGSCIVEQPNGDLLVCWFHGSGERKADDVAIYGARLVQGEDEWRGPFVMADVKEFPDTNCCMMIEPSGKLWLIWPTIIANQWETALLNIQKSFDYQDDIDLPPHWDSHEIMPMKPGEKFAEHALPVIEEYQTKYGETSPRASEYLNVLKERVQDKYFRRMGWMTRAHPTILESGRIVIPLYSDGFSFSLMALTDNGGETWQFSTPLVGGGNIQPSVVQKQDGSLVAIMRDNGPAPKRAHVSVSKDEGLTWGPVVDSDLPNPGAGLEWIVLESGEWVIIYNDTEDGRHRLAVSISDDEGKTWNWTRYLEKMEPEQGSFHYPSIIQANDGSLHASYSYFGDHETYGKDRKSIKHAHFNVEWIKKSP